MGLFVVSKLNLLLNPVKKIASDWYHQKTSSLSENLGEGPKIGWLTISLPRLQ